MTRILLWAAALPALAACDRAPPEPRVTVDDAVVILPVLPDRPGAAYFTLSTNNDPTRLVAVSSPSIGRVELHESVTTKGVTRMVPLRDTSFAPDAPLQFEAGRRHAMLMEIDPAVGPGSKVRLTFTFTPAPPVTIDAEVRSAGDPGHGAH